VKVTGAYHRPEPLPFAPGFHAHELHSKAVKEVLSGKNCMNSAYSQIGQEATAIREALEGKRMTTFLGRDYL
jgi:hypothetical protein